MRCRNDLVGCNNRVLGPRIYNFPRASLDERLLRYIVMTSRSTVRHTRVRMIKAEMVLESEDPSRQSP